MKKVSFKLDDGGRHLSRRPHQSNDCTVRSIAIVTGKPYDTIYDELAKDGRKPCEGHDPSTWLKKHNFRRIRTHLTPKAFVLKHPKGRYLLETAVHIWALIDGCHHDMNATRNISLTEAWQYEKN